ncbi:MAG: hypothetical protein KKD55_00305, partial [Candidatus Omnitrophica bacterium]|nr:hypothetical protein [Candidatus Omnitrophota bacterium]
ASRDARKEVDSQLKVFFKELREIKAVIRDTRSSMIDTRKKKKDGKGALNSVKRVTRKGRKMKFRPEITRVKLNPEQAVLSCTCYDDSKRLPDPPHFYTNSFSPSSGWATIVPSICLQYEEGDRLSLTNAYVCDGGGVNMGFRYIADSGSS